MRLLLPLLAVGLCALLAGACASKKAAPASNDPAWSVLYDGKAATRGAASSGNECRVGRDGVQVCGYNCRTGSDGVVRCASTPGGICTMGGDGRARCRDPLFPGEVLDAPDGGISG